MKSRFAIATATAIAFGAAVACQASAQDFDAGYDAYTVGDYATAYSNFLPLAEQGHANAQSNLGNMYIDGLGVPQDNAEAVRWYRLAADQADAHAQTGLGIMYSDGLGVPQDNAEAVRRFRLAADQGYALAQGWLGSMYENGLGVPQHYLLAHMWYNISSANGVEYAASSRDDLVTRMTPEQVADAQERARVCMGSGYQSCD
jgi:TPR repeat protein